MTELETLAPPLPDVTVADLLAWMPVAEPHGALCCASGMTLLYGDGTRSVRHSRAGSFDALFPERSRRRR